VQDVAQKARVATDRRAIVSRAILGGHHVPATVPGEKLTSEDMARVSEDDWADIRSLARRYCRTVDASRSRKRMDRSATVTRDGAAPYGTDDVSDDVTQDAALIFAQRLGEIIATCASSSVRIDTRETDSWQYIRRDRQTIIVTRETLQRWAVRDAAARNGYRLDVPADETDATPGAQRMRGLAHAENVAKLALVSSQCETQSEAIFRSAWGDGRDFPTLGRVIFLAGAAEDLGRAGIFATTAQTLHGGAYGSRRNVIRTRDAAAAEWGELSARLDDARDTLVYCDARATDTV
jgi:galactarate dehydratase